MIANLAVTNPKIIEIQEGTRKELSCGYDCDVTEGVTYNKSIFVVIT